MGYHGGAHAILGCSCASDRISPCDSFPTAGGRPLLASVHRASSSPADGKAFDWRFKVGVVRASDFCCDDHFFRGAFQKDRFWPFGVKAAKLREKTVRKEYRGRHIDHFLSQPMTEYSRVPGVPTSEMTEYSYLEYQTLK